MATEIPRMNQPIDVMYLIHKALEGQAAQVEALARDFQEGDSLQPIRTAFNRWAAALVFHAEQEDRYMTAPLENFPPARDNESEHVQLADLLGDLNSFLDHKNPDECPKCLKDAMRALNEQQHLDLMERLEDVMAVLHEEIGKSRVIARTQRHLYGKIVALRISQDDHLESEEAFVLPEVCEKFSGDQQVGLVRELLIDQQSEDPRWVIEWMSGHLTPDELQMLHDLEDRFALTPAS